jgi:hypothetical protein
MAELTTPNRGPFANGETRTRTGDTTIQSWSRIRLTAAESLQICGTDRWPDVLLGPIEATLPKRSLLEVKGVDQD